MADEIQTNVHSDKRRDEKDETITPQLEDSPEATIKTTGAVGNHGAPGPGIGGRFQRLHDPRIRITGRPLRGTRSPGVGYLFVLLSMFFIIAAGTLLSGGFIPVDPNSPQGPPTLPPYYGLAEGLDEQQLILPPEVLTPGSDENLQLKTFRVNVCGQITAIDFLIDTSGSMQFENKMDKLKGALRSFTGELSNSAVIGMHSFSATTEELVPLDFYKNNKQQVEASIDALSPNGWTVTRDGFNMSKQALTEVITKNRFPGYNYHLVLITDGIPEIPQYPDAPPRVCLATAPEPLITGGVRCFAEAQDPRVPTDLSQDLKSLGVEIYTIGIYSQQGSDRVMQPYLEALLQDVSSEPKNTHYYASLEGNNLENILDSILNTACKGLEDQKLDLSPTLPPVENNG